MKILFTDTHFGIKQNSQTWLQSQLDFLNQQLIPYIVDARGKGQEVTLVHLGDVFDSRSTISVLIASEVKKAFSHLADLVDEFIIIGGNHDYYSPNQSHVDTLDLIFGDIGNITLVTENNQPMITRGREGQGDLYLSWYAWHEHMDTVVEWVEKFRPARIFTHADIYGLTPGSPKIPDELSGIRIYSGHIHIPNFKVSGLNNLGSCYPLSFADCNSQRGFYVQVGDSLEFHPNTSSISFWRIRGEAQLQELIGNPKNKKDYIEVYLPREKIIDPSIQTLLKSLDYKNLWIIPEIDHGLVMEQADLKSLDIDACIDKLVPEALKDKMAQVRAHMNSEEEDEEE